jgi:hypothetical protein
MKEPVFNIFMFIDADELIGEIGCVRHERDGTDAAKLDYLRSRVEEDYRIARRFPVPRGYLVILPDGNEIRGAMRWQTFDQMRQMNKHYEVLEVVFAALGAPREPLSVITAVVDGQPRIDGLARFDITTNSATSGR